jgi:hypothetical protein
MKESFRQPSIIMLFIITLTGSIIGANISNYFNSNKSELLDAMSSASRVQLVKDTEQLNKLIDDLRKTKSKGSSNRQEISKLYLSLASTLTNDLRNIQLKDPRIAANTRVTIDGLRGLSTDIMKEDIYPSSFQPENIRR